jgi:hypothetical protein
VTLPRRVRVGETAALAIAAPRPSEARDVFHVEAVDPFGNLIAARSGNWLAPGGVASPQLRFAPDDPTGRWTIRITDRLSGRTVGASIEVDP